MNAFLQELFQVGMYKRSQGRITRQVTLGAMALAVGFGFYRLHTTMIDVPDWWIGTAATWSAISYGVPFLLALLAWWICFRLINVPRFADFLIAVEAEMNKVSWPSRAELARSSIVVLVTIFVLGSVLFFYDFFWRWLFKALHILS